MKYQLKFQRKLKFIGNPVKISMKTTFDFNTNGNPLDSQLKFQLNTNVNPFENQLEFNLNYNGIPLGSNINPV